MEGRGSGRRATVIPVHGLKAVAAIQLRQRYVLICSVRESECMCVRAMRVWVRVCVRPYICVFVYVCVRACVFVCMYIGVGVFDLIFEIIRIRKYLQNILTTGPRLHT